MTIDEGPPIGSPEAGKSPNIPDVERALPRGTVEREVVYTVATDRPTVFSHASGDAGRETATVDLWSDPGHPIPRHDSGRHINDQFYGLTQRKAD